MQKKYILGSVAVLAIAAGVAAVSVKVCAENNKGTAARVNGEVITVEEIKQSYANNPQIAAQVPFDEFYGKAVDIYVNGKLIYQAAQKAKIEETPEYKEQLKTAKEDLARKIYLEKSVAEKVTPEAVQDVYDNTYLKDFKSQKEAKAKHILVADNNTAKEVIEKLNKGEDFDKLAKEYSKDRQVELNYFTKNIMVPEFSEAAFALKKGAYTKTPVKTQFGYHVILLEDLRDSSPLPLKDLEPQIRNALAQRAVAATFDELYSTSQIEKFDLNGKKIAEDKVESGSTENKAPESDKADKAE